jgi:hypothetical protein
VGNESGSTHAQTFPTKKISTSDVTSPMIRYAGFDSESPMVSGDRTGRVPAIVTSSSCRRGLARVFGKKVRRIFRISENGDLLGTCRFRVTPPRHSPRRAAARTGPSRTSYPRSRSRVASVSRDASAGVEGRRRFVFPF